MRKWGFERKDSDLTEAFETYTSLLAEWDLDEDEMTFNEDKFKELAQKAEVFFLSLEDVLKFRRMHEYAYEDDKNPFQGVIVVIQNESGRNLVIDGNHRLNTLAQNQESRQVPIIIIRGVFVG